MAVKDVLVGTAEVLGGVGAVALVAATLPADAVVAAGVAVVGLASVAVSGCTARVVQPSDVYHPDTTSPLPTLTGPANSGPTPPLAKALCGFRIQNPTNVAQRALVSIATPAEAPDGGVPTPTEISNFSQWTTKFDACAAAEAQALPAVLAAGDAGSDPYQTAADAVSADCSAKTAAELPGIPAPKMSSQLIDIPAAPQDPSAALVAAPAAPAMLASQTVQEQTMTAGACSAWAAVGPVGSPMAPSQVTYVPSKLAPIPEYGTQSADGGVTLLSTGVPVYSIATIDYPETLSLVAPGKYDSSSDAGKPSP